MAYFSLKMQEIGHTRMCLYLSVLLVHMQFLILYLSCTLTPAETNNRETLYNTSTQTQKSEIIFFRMPLVHCIF